MYVCMFVDIAYVLMCMLYISMCWLCIYTYIYIYIYIYTHTYDACMYDVRMCVCMYICMHACMYVGDT